MPQLILNTFYLPTGNGTDAVEIINIDDGSGINNTVTEKRVFDMVSYRSDLKTKIVFNRLSNGACQLHCTVITSTNKLFVNETTGEKYEIEHLPTLYLVEGRTDCRGLIEEGGEVYVKVISKLMSTSDIKGVSVRKIFGVELSCLDPQGVPGGTLLSKSQYILR